MMSKNRAVSSRRFGWTLPALVLALGAIAVPAQAQDFPSRTVKIVVPFPAGGTADVMPRIIADWLSRNWGQSVIIEDRTGAGGNVGAEVAAKSDPDGYTLLASPPPTACDQSKPLSASRLRSAAVRAHHRHRTGAERAGGQS